MAAFQAGTNVVNFESIPAHTPQTIVVHFEYPVFAISFIFNQISGVQFSDGRAQYTIEPALYLLSGRIAGDATPLAHG